MRSSRGISVWLLILIMSTAGNLVAAGSHPDYLIDATRAGAIKLGMSLRTVRKLISPMTLQRTTDGEGLALVAVMQGSSLVMRLFAGERNASIRINDRHRVEQIEVHDARFHIKD